MGACEVHMSHICLHVWKHVLICASVGFFAFSCMGIVGELAGMCRSLCKCLLLKQTRHLNPTGPELGHHTPWNLKPDAGSWAARVIRGTHHAGGVTVWLRCPIRHTTDRPQPTPAWTQAPATALSPGQTEAAWGDLSIGAAMAPKGPTYPSVCAGSSNSLKGTDLRC